MIFFLKSILILVALSACAAQTSVANEKSKWGYRDPNELGPEEWSTKYPLCGGTKQSPINVVTRNEHKIDNRNFAGELHLVHTNLNATQGYCVLGFLLEVIDQN